MIWKGMGREAPAKDPRDLEAVRCEKCNGPVFEGDWPFCKGKPEDHKR